MWYKVPSMLLNKLSIFCSNNLNEIKNFIENASGVSMHNAKIIKRPGPAFLWNGMAASLGMFYAASNVSATYDLDPADFIRLVFQIKEVTRITIGGYKIISTPGYGGHIIPEGLPARVDHPEGSKSLSLRIDPAALHGRLNVLTGIDIEGTIKFIQPLKLDAPSVRFMRHTIFDTAHELDTVNSIFHPHILDELNKMVLTRLLLYGRHSHSHLLEIKVSSSRPSRMKTLDEYIRENLQHPLNIEHLASFSGVSIRTLFRQFYQTYDMTPHDYIRDLRLNKAHEMLLKSKDEDSVLGIASLCGFKSFGHFADLYRRRYGELPSVTLKESLETIISRD